MFKFSTNNYLLKDMDITILDLRTILIQVKLREISNDEVDITLH